MFTSLRVLLFLCVGFSVVQAYFTEDYATGELISTDEYFNTEFPDYVFPPSDEYVNTEYPDFMFTEPSDYMDCPPNNVLQCMSTCAPDQTCREHREKLTLTCTEDVEPSYCKHTCMCAPGYFRNTNGVCVTEKQCDKCPGPNEHYACGGSCDNICDTLHLQNKTSCPGYNESDCHPSCYCDDGYARDASGVCIPIHECPIPKCGKNEVFTECKKSRSCLDETCSSKSFPSYCDSEELCATVGCVCKEGYFRIEENAPCLHFCECPLNSDSTECAHASKKFSYYLFKLLGY